MCDNARRRLRIRQDVALDEVVACGTLVEALLEVVCSALAFELEGFRLESSEGMSDGTLAMGEMLNIRRSSSVKQDMSVLEVLGLWAVLQVLLEAVAALVAADRRDGRLIDDVFGGFGGHGQ
jgi:hypothetical protein